MILLNTSDIVKGVVMFSVISTLLLFVVLRNEKQRTSKIINYFLTTIFLPPWAVYSFVKYCVQQYLNNRNFN